MINDSMYFLINSPSPLTKAKLRDLVRRDLRCWEFPADAAVGEIEFFETSESSEL